MAITCHDSNFFVYTYSSYTHTHTHTYTHLFHSRQSQMEIACLREENVKLLTQSESLPPDFKINRLATEVMT
jgi:hypothetical protein